MAERSVHEAVVEAVAERAYRRVWPDGPSWDEADDWIREPYEAALAALVASAEVRERLVAALADHACPPSEECIDGRVARAKAAAILAALGGTEAT